MTTLENLITALAGVFAVGCTVRLIILAINMSMAEDKSSYKLQIKHIIIVLIISVIVGFGSAFNMILNKYFK